MGNRGKPLELDGYAESLAIAFEYHGKQHYETTWRFDANTVRDQQERDALKLRLCHERGVRLVVVPQFRSFGNLSGCIDQIEAAVLFAGLKVPRWKRPADLSELMVDAPMKPRKRAPETNGLDLFAGAAMP